MSVVFRRAPWRKPHRRRFILSKASSIEVNATYTVSSQYLSYTGHTGDGSGMRDGIWSGTVSAASVWASNASGTAGVPEYIRADLGSVQTVARVSIAPTTSGTVGPFAAEHLNGALLQYSTDGSSWTTHTTMTGFVDQVAQEYSLGVTARYVRIAREDNYVACGDFRIFAAVSSSDTITVSPASLTLTGGSVVEVENEIVSQASLTLTGRSVLELETEAVGKATLTLSGGTVTPVDGEIVPVTAAALTLTGRSITEVENEIVSRATLTLTGYDISTSDTVPVVIGGSMAGGGGGPASDAVYNARRKYEQDKRDREEALWKGKPSTTLPDSPKKPPQASVEVKKTVTSPPADIGPDIAALIAEILAPMPMPMPLPMPDRHFDPEEDAAALLLLTEL